MDETRTATYGAVIKIAHRPDSPRLNFALSKLDKAIKELNRVPKHCNLEMADSVDILIVASAKEAAKFSELPNNYVMNAEGFSIGRLENNGKSAVFVLATDESGAMYGTLELAEQLMQQGKLSGIPEMTANPKFSFRAIKFNLPWSGYRTNESVDNQTETVRDIAFWRKFLDMMAENRFNVLTLWNLHPFPYMIRPANFPLACPLSDQELQEWIHYWTELFRLAKERGIETYIVNWNLMVSEAFRMHYDENASNDAIHWGEAYSTEQIVQYTRECVTQLIDEYPDLGGVGTSVGEHLDGWTPEQRQEWIADVYFTALKSAKRPVSFIHRAPFTVDPEVTRKSIERSGIPGSVYLEIKYNFSHGYSSPKLFTVHGGSSGIEKYWNPEPVNYKLTLMVRNEDFFTLRWAQSEYIRDHISENSDSHVAGYYIGSEGFIPAMDYSHVKGSDHITWEYAFEKNRLYYMMWGKLLYDPSAPDSVFIADIDRRHGRGVGGPLLKAYSYACRMPMALAVFCASTWDFSLYAEGFIATKFPARSFTSKEFAGYEIGKSFINIQDLCNYKTLDPHYLSVKTFADHVLNGISDNGGITPVELAAELEENAKNTFASLDAVPANTPSLECEIADIKAWAYLSLYFAQKLRAAVAFEIYCRTGEQEQKAKALYHLKAPHAAEHWENLISATKSHYVEQPLVSLGNVYFSWELLRQDVKADIDYVENS